MVDDKSMEDNGEARWETTVLNNLRKMIERGNVILGTGQELAFNSYTILLIDY